MPVTLIAFIFCVAANGTENIGLNIAGAAQQQIGVTVIYDPSYTKLDYPDGDIPISRGVCTDVIIRALREVGYDLQKLIHEDMQHNFSEYPQKWGLSEPDKNIDHRRVLNQMCWFKRIVWNIEISNNPKDYRPGDIVAWQLKNNRYHIGIIAGDFVENDKIPLAIHNIGHGTQKENVLFAYKIIGVYRPQTISAD